MGIKDLLPQLKSITKRKNIRDYGGYSVAIDGYCWLHQGAYTCAMELVYGRGIPKLVEYCRKRLELMQTYNVRPILIFDGAKLQMKEGTEQERAKNRKENLRKAQECMARGDSQQAHKYFSIAVDITPEMAYQLCCVAKKMGVEYYVAPYEADAQLAYMYFSGRCQMVITEDSDLLAFGVQKCFFKMDSNGDGHFIDMSLLQQVTELNFQKFDQETFLTLCILSGCDYIKSLPGIGLKRAHRLVQDQSGDFQAVVRKVRKDGKVVIPRDYEETFQKALLTFKFQRVYCPERKQLVHLNDPDSHPLGFKLKSYPDLDWLGPLLPIEIAQKIANCEIDPQTHIQYSLTVHQPQEKQRRPEKTTQVVQFKKNKSAKKNSQSQVEVNPKSVQTLKKFFGVAPQKNKTIELVDHDENKEEIKEEKNEIQSVSVPNFQGFEAFKFKKIESQITLATANGSQNVDILETPTEIKKLVVGENNNPFIQAQKAMIEDQSPALISKFFKGPSQKSCDDSDSQKSWTARVNNNDEPKPQYQIQSTPFSLLDQLKYNPQSSISKQPFNVPQGKTPLQRIQESTKNVCTKVEQASEIRTTLKQTISQIQQKQPLDKQQTERSPLQQSIEKFNGNIKKSSLTDQKLTVYEKQDSEVVQEQKAPIKHSNQESALAALDRFKRIRPSSTNPKTTVIR